MFLSSLYYLYIICLFIAFVFPSFIALTLEACYRAQYAWGGCNIVTNV